LKFREFEIIYNFLHHNNNMPNKKGGKGYKKGKKGGGREFKEDFDTTDGKHFYATVLNRLGDNKLSVRLTTGTEMVAIIPGKFYKKLWCNKDDTVVVMCDEMSCELAGKVTKQETKCEASSAMMKGDGHDVFSMFEFKDDGEDKESNLEKITKTLETVRSDKPGVNTLDRKQRDKERTLQRRRDEVRAFDGEGRRAITDVAKRKTAIDDDSSDSSINVDDI
jgi:translation initiation factor IF-1